jgi:hypothetical protein
LLNDIFHILSLFSSISNSHLLLTYHIYLLPHLEQHADSILSRIPVTDIAQPCGVNAMKVSER